jgi:diguanylate cyclase (GGDEF)-like protein
LTQRPWTSLVLLPLAVAAFFALYGGPAAVLAAWLPISVLVWLATAETVAGTGGAVDDLETQAHWDPLTELSNRNRLTERLARLGPDAAVLLVDLNHCKRINDRHGHVAGDAVLRNFGTEVCSVVRGRDKAIRYGGEECLLLLGFPGVAGAQLVDARLRAAWQQLRPDVTSSSGLAAVGPAGSRPVLQRADAALYLAKAAGRNRTVVDAAREHADTSAAADTPGATVLAG